MLPAEKRGEDCDGSYVYEDGIPIGEPLFTLTDEEFDYLLLGFN
jgi:hypothetical protein